MKSISIYKDSVIISNFLMDFHVKISRFNTLITYESSNNNTDN